jgi:hypothetical protein
MLNPSASALRSKARRARMTPQQRTAEKLYYSAKRRADLIVELAPDLCCAECGLQVHDARELQVDHVDGRDWCLDDYSPSVRYARYWREYLAGVLLRALCGMCNAIDGGGRRYGYDRRRRS